MTDFQIHSKPGCPNCERAKRALTVKGFAYVETIYSTPETITYFKEVLGFRSFPMVFHGEELVGTADQLEGYLKRLDEADDF